MDFSSIVAAVNNFVWGPYMLVFLVGTGVFLTIRLKFLPWRNLPHALHEVFSKRENEEEEQKGDISPFQSLMTALAADRHRQYRRRRDCDGSRRTRRNCLDVDFRVVRFID